MYNTRLCFCLVCVCTRGQACAWKAGTWLHCTEKGNLGTRMRVDGVVKLRKEHASMARLAAGLTFPV
jgi:mRNA-degrading endonuclease toxin of MazEF toxin-antitoxin module